MKITFTPNTDPPQYQEPAEQPAADIPQGIVTPPPGIHDRKPRRLRRWLIGLIVLNVILMPALYFLHLYVCGNNAWPGSGFMKEPLYFMGSISHSDTTTDTMSFSKHISLYSNGSANTDLYGIDVSYCQTYIDWQYIYSDTTPRKIDFAIIKSTQGSYLADPYFALNWKNARHAGIILGAYHFYIYDDDPVQQANNFIAHTPLQKGDFRPIIDIELICETCPPSEGKEQLLNGLHTFLTAIENHYQTKPILYSSMAFSEEYLTEEFPDYPFWIARYSSIPPTGFNISGDNGQSTNVLMWQFTCKGTVNGISDHVDMNFTHGENMLKLIY